MKPIPEFFEHAQAHHQAGRLVEAERDYLETLKADDRHGDALRLLAALYVQMSQPSRAIEFFERAHHLQPGNAETLNNLGVALRHCGRFAEAMERYEQAVALDPHHAQSRANLLMAYAECGNEFAQKQEWDSAVECFEKALRIDPQNYRLLNNLGGVWREQGRAPEACDFYRQALRINPDYAEAFINLGNALRDLGKLDESRESYEAALRLKPDSLEALNNLGTLMQDLRCYDEAIACYDKALRADANSIDAKTNKAFALLALGRYREGWALNEAGLGVKEKRGPAPFTTRMWDGGPFPNQRLLIWCEQGLGDSLQFVRYVALCKQRGGKVIVLAPKPLVRLFANCPFIDEAITEASESSFDYQVAMMSLPHIFETTLETIPSDVPYLFISDEARAKRSPKFKEGVPSPCGRVETSSPERENFGEGSKLKVGLVWAGRAREHRADLHLVDKRRSINLALLKPLLETQARFYSLQMGKPAAQIDELGLRDRIVDLMPEVSDMLDTAAIIEQLDLVISVDTSVVHLAGGLGKPVWMLSRYDACWRWLRNRETNPWYPTAKIFGQSASGEWKPVILNIARELANSTAAR